MGIITAITVLVIIIITLPVFMDIMAAFTRTAFTTGTALTITVDLDITGFKPMELRVDCVGLTMVGAVGTAEAGLLMGAEASTATRMSSRQYQRSSP